MGAHGTNNKQQAMCSTHRDIWWPARAHQQDRDKKCKSSKPVFYKDNKNNKQKSTGQQTKIQTLILKANPPSSNLKTKESDKISLSAFQNALGRKLNI